MVRSRFHMSIAEGVVLHMVKVPAVRCLPSWLSAGKQPCLLVRTPVETLQGLALRCIHTNPGS